MSILDQKFQELEKRLEQADQAGGPKKIAKHHQAGKLTARERVLQLVDEGVLSKKLISLWSTGVSISEWKRHTFQEKV